MTDTLATLRAEAEALARELDSPSPALRASATAHAGSAGRRRAGTGEQFWQYRRHATEDAPSRIDWRRSARGDTLFVRETELETARTYHVWADPHPGFDWASEGVPVTKADRARIILMAIASRLSRDGERVGVPGGQPAGFGGRALQRIGEDLLSLNPSSLAIPAPRSRSIALVASDFYDPKPEWRERLAPLVHQCQTGVLLAVSDPAEIAFAYSGRVEFERPGSETRRLIERAERVREAYVEKFATHKAELRDLAASLGWALVEHVTDEPALPAAYAITQLIEALAAAQAGSAKR